MYAWSVEKLPEVLKVSDEILIVHNEEAVQIFAKPLTRLSDILAMLYEHFSHLGYVPFELIPNADRAKPAEGAEE
ncbi:hypothetical protein D3C86_1426790 [compost metagenome]